MATKEDVNDLTAAELHDKAKEAGLSGTSHMKKDELIEALNGASEEKPDGGGGKALHGKSTTHDDGANRERDDKGHFVKSDAKKND